ncbi:hypothetical protein CH063_09814 [Colletotrichum higginsianum]|uniref:Uncharacterized protein n=1 Tax=Colletotrichum higginsianum (strain IMI 349063) TaxID=759273 RepID=H1VF19_COLHI|nr:hypothetical protein CH063_09814 [Colletotrichum higginsianum]
MLQLGLPVSRCCLVFWYYRLRGCENCSTLSRFKLKVVRHRGWAVGGKPSDAREYAPLADYFSIIPWCIILRQSFLVDAMAFVLSSKTPIEVCRRRSKYMALQGFMDIGRIQYLGFWSNLYSSGGRKSRPGSPTSWLVISPHKTIVANSSTSACPSCCRLTKHRQLQADSRAQKSTGIVDRSFEDVGSAAYDLLYLHLPDLAATNCGPTQPET